MLESCKTALAPWINDMVEIIIPLLDYLFNENVRIIAADCLPHMITALGEDQAKRSAVTKKLVSELWKVMQGESEPETLIYFSKSMQKVIQKGGRLFTNEELMAICGKCEEQLVRSDKRKQAAEEHRDEDEEEKEIIDVLEAEKDVENELHCQIAEIFGKLFMTHKEATVNVALQLDNHLITKSLDKNAHHRINKFGLFLICDIVDHLGEFPQIREQLFQVFFN